MGTALVRKRTTTNISVDKSAKHCKKHISRNNSSKKLTLLSRMILQNLGYNEDILNITEPIVFDEILLTFSITINCTAATILDIRRKFAYPFTIRHLYTCTQKFASGAGKRPWEYKHTEILGITHKQPEHIPLKRSEAVLLSNTGAFEVLLPFATVLEFFDDHDEILFNGKQELVLVHSNNDVNALLSERNAAPKFELTAVEWIISWDLYTYLNFPRVSKQVWQIKTSHQLEKHLYVILTFQTNRDRNLKKDRSLFDNCKLSNVKLYPNSECYPHSDLNINFQSNSYSMLYEMNKVAEPLLSPADFSTKAPLVFLDTGIVDAHLEFELFENCPADTSVYCLVIHDKIYRKTFDGTVKKIILAWNKFCDVQGFQNNGNCFVLKEIAFSHLTETLHTCLWLSCKFHGLLWEDGQVEYFDAKYLFRKLVNTEDTVYVKEGKKTKWLENILGTSCNIVDLEDYGCPALQVLKRET
ncbi:hypothetical protein PR048_029125 [Dryococelus australis]|uniref:Double jelly roll-like domain-containing protein n=1 Tax=Dryococelus australis TaxID=614101 RepID=A0ABQ9GCI5_9NEOP|nr:hypothetical protein PR048_029125 [Dryococelus australis]